MNEKQKKTTISLVVIMIICVILTSLLLTNSLECDSCHNRITGKYYITLSERPYCKECGEEYYRGFPGDMDNVSDSVNNTLRNILVIAELIGFIGAIVVINKQKIAEGVKKVEPKVGTYKEPIKTEPIRRNPVDPIERKPVTEVKTEEKINTVPEVRREEPKVESTDVRSGLRTTFKTKSEEEPSFNPSPSTTTSTTSKTSEDKNEWFSSAGDL